MSVTLGVLKATPLGDQRVALVLVVPVVGPL